MEAIVRVESDRRIVTVGKWTFQAVDDDEPRIRDVDLGERLGYERPRKLRDLVARLIRSKKLSGVLERPTVGRGRNQHGETSAIYEVNEYWLTEAQALKVAAKSETEPADAILDEMIHVFMLARRGLLPQTEALTVVDHRLDRMEAAIVAMQASQSTMATSIATAVAQAMGGVIHELMSGRHDRIGLEVAGAAGARHICGFLRRYGELMGGDDKTEVKRWRHRAETELRGFLGYSGGGRAWADLPNADYAKARLRLREMLTMAERASASRRKPPLPGME